MSTSEMERAGSRRSGGDRSKRARLPPRAARARARGGDAARAAHAPADRRLRRVRARRSSASCTSCCRSSPAWARRSTTSRAETSGGSRVGVVLELLSFAGYVVLFRSVFVVAEPPTSRIGWQESYEITMAGLVATRLFAAAGAGGVALTAWALRRSGMAPRLVACRMVAFIVLLYVIYAGSLLIDGIGLGIGLFPGGGSFAITIVPGDRRRDPVRRGRRDGAAAGDLERRLRQVGVRLRSLHPLGRPRRRRAGARRQRRAHRDRADPHPRRRRCWGRPPGGASTSPSCGRCSTRSARRRRSPSS